MSFAHPIHATGRSINRPRQKTRSMANLTPSVIQAVNVAYQIINHTDDGLVNKLMPWSVWLLSCALEILRLRLRPEWAKRLFKYTVSYRPWLDLLTIAHILKIAIGEVVLAKNINQC